jgi:hypothetical protein
VKVLLGRKLVPRGKEYCGRGLDSFVSGQAHLTHGNEYSCSVEGGEFLD